MRRSGGSLGAFPRAFAGAITIFAGIALASLALAAEPGGKALDAEQAKLWRGVGQIRLHGQKSQSLCTGTLVAPDLVLTAAHCVVNQKTGRIPRLDRIRFIAGWHKGKGTGESRAADVIVHPFYEHGGDPRTLASDVALIRLREPLPPEAATPFATAPAPSSRVPILVITYQRKSQDHLTYQDECKYERRVGPILVLNCKLSSGASGGPVFAKIDGEWHQIAVLMAIRSGKGAPLAYALEAHAALRNLRGLLRDLPGASAATLPAGP